MDNGNEEWLVFNGDQVLPGRQKAWRHQPGELLRFSKEKKRKDSAGSDDTATGGMAVDKIRPGRPPVVL